MVDWMSAQKETKVNMAKITDYNPGKRAEDSEVKSLLKIRRSSEIDTK